MDRMGIWPEQLADYLALVGDSVDNIPGVPGIGAKTAAVLLQHFGDIQTLLQAGDQIAEVPVRGAKNLSAKIDTYGEQILIARKLASIAEDAPVGNPELTRQPIALDALADFCQRMGLGERLLERAERLIDSVESGAE